MAEESLKIVLTADNKQAISAMKETVTSLNQVDAAASKTGGKVVSMGKDFTGLSRVIQDLPYGFNAIANNLTNILPAAGALGLGISALVAGLQFAQLGFANWTRGLNNTEEKLKETEKENEKFRQSLAKERAELDILFATATNANVPMAARLKAVKDLRNEYGGYLKNYTDEEILVGKAADAHKKLAEAILKTAQAQALRDAVQKDYDALIKLDQDLADAKNKKLQDDREMLAKSKGVYKENLAAQDRLAKEEKRIADERYKIQQEINRKINSITDLSVAPFGGGNGDKEKKTKPWNAIKQWEMRTLIKPKEEDEMKKNKDAFDKYVASVRLGTEANRAYSAVARENYLINVANSELTQTATQYTDMAMNSLNGLINAMINGQNVGMALGDMFKRLAADIALAAAKALIFESLMNILMPGKAAGKAAFGAGKAVAKIFGFASGGTVTGPRSGYPVMLHGTEHIVRPDQMRSIIASAAQMGGGSNRVIVEGRIRGNDIWLSQSRTDTFRALSA